MTHKCVSTLTIIGPDNGLVPDLHQGIIWTNAVILPIRPKGTYFSEIIFDIQMLSIKEMHLKMSARWQQYRLSLNVLNITIRSNQEIKVHSAACKSWMQQITLVL